MSDPSYRIITHTPLDLWHAV